MTAAIQPARVSALTVLLVGCNLALAASVGAQLWRGSQRSALLASAAKPLDIEAQQFGVPPQRQVTDELQSQALFHSSRNFYVPPAPVTQQRLPPDYRVAGVFRTPGRPVTALLIQNQTGTRVKVSSGDLLEDWQVEEIRPGKIQLTLNEQRAELTTQSAAVVATATQPSVAIALPATGGISVVPRGAGGQTYGNPAPGTRRVLSAPRTTGTPQSGNVPDTAVRLYRPPL